MPSENLARRSVVVMSAMEFKDINEFYQAVKTAWEDKQIELYERLIREGRIQRSWKSTFWSWISSRKLNLLDELLVLAVHDGSLELCQQLFMKGALFDAPGYGLRYTAMGAAVYHQHIEIGRQFLIYNDQYNLDVDLTPILIQASQRNRLEFIELLLDHGADASLINESNICNYRTHWEVLDCLIRNGALFNEDTLKIWEGEKPKRLKAEKRK